MFSAGTKFDSGTGWPSFWGTIKREKIIEEIDNGLFIRRTEIVCDTCGAHLGHVFDDGPEPTGLQYLSTQEVALECRDKVGIQITRNLSFSCSYIFFISS